MDESTFQQPTPDDLGAFVAGDPIAIDRVMRLVIPQLHLWAAWQYPNLPEDEVKSVLHQVLAETCRRHSRYDSRRAKFTTYVIGLAMRRMREVHRAEEHRRVHEDSSLDAHEKLLRLPYNPSGAYEITTRLTRDEFLGVVRERTDELELEFLHLMLQGEKRLEVFVAVLHRHDVQGDPAREVKNAKERLVRKMRAVARERGYSLADLVDL